VSFRVAPLLWQCELDGAAAVSRILVFDADQRAAAAEKQRNHDDCEETEGELEWVKKRVLLHAGSAASTTASSGAASAGTTASRPIEEAVRDRHLVPYRPVHTARTDFQIEGLKPGELPAEFREQIEAQGVDPADFSFEGTDLEKTVTNTGTTDAIVVEFMDYCVKDPAGVPGKAIIFAVSHRHAMDLLKSFNRLYPDLQRRGLAEVIDSQMERAEAAIDDFKNQDMPRVAISVDMLDTGIDVPAIRTLVFAKPVFSKTKFWQMLGRGTRKDPDAPADFPKNDFLIIDHWGNFDYFQVNKDGRKGSTTEPLPTRVFRLRLEKLEILTARGHTADAGQTVAALQQMLASIPLENINVAPHADDIRGLAEAATAWSPLDDEHLGQWRTVIAPLLRFAFTGTLAELQFENLTEQLALAQLKADAGEIEALRERIVENLNLLPRELPEIRPHLEALTFAISPAFWQHLDYARVMELQARFAPLMRFRSRRERPTFVRLSMPDEVRERRWIIFGAGGEGAFAVNYRARVETLVRSMLGENTALQRIKRGEDISPDELNAVAASLNGPDLFVTEERLREAYEQPAASLGDFLRHILEVARLPSREERISAAFDAWVRAHPRLTATQLMFVRTLRQAVIQRAEITTLDELHQPPFSSIGDPEQLFTRADVDALLSLVRLNAAA
jgi:type I restriction enzyme R subunit